MTHDPHAAALRTIAITATLDHLGWFKIPRTLDQIVGIYAEATAEAQRPRRHGLSNDELVDGIRAATNAAGFGKGGHSDPTPEAALRGQPDAIDDDVTLDAIDSAVASIAEAAATIDRACSDALGLARWEPEASWNGRQGQLSDAATRLAHLRPNLEPALAVPGADVGYIDHLVRADLADNAAWLRTKCEGIWDTSRGAERTTTDRQPGRQPDPCTNCAGHGITGTLATSTGLCTNCQRFQSDEKCLPDQRICRAWDRGSKSIPNGWKIEAKAAFHAQVKSRRGRAS